MHKKRLCSVYFLFLTAMLLVCSRLYVITTDGSSAEKVLSDQYTRRIDIVKRQGFVFDRNGVMTDMKESSYILFVDPSEIAKESYGEYANSIGESSSGEASYYFEKLFSSVPFTTVSNKPIDEVGVKSYPVYSFCEGDFLCHVSGYCNSDGIGMSGIRKAYDAFLNDNAKNVSAIYKANAKGGEIKNAATMIEDNGYMSDHGVYLTIDTDIQKTVEKHCASMLASGAVIVQNINNGEILALHSRPTYDISDIAMYLDSDKGELINRAVLGYTPGSVFKTVVCAAALEEDISYFDREYECKGYIEIAGTKISCHKKDGHGVLKMRDAFSQSCNPYFIDLVCEIGIDCVCDMAESMGIGKISDVDKLPVVKGSVCDDEKTDALSCANISIGQGSVLITPLEMNTVMICAVTGNYTPPSLVERLVSQNGTEYIHHEDKIKILSPYTVAAMRSMLGSCVNNGTGYRVKSEKVSCAGKTATAQSGQIKDGKEVIHSWFSGYFPADEPLYAVTVLCDGNGEKNSHSSDIFRKIAEEIVKLKGVA